MSKKYGIVRTSALHGINGMIVDIEVVISSGLPGFDIVGLADSAIRESRNRVQAAIRSSGFIFPMNRITASLAPAYLRKQGSAFDFPLALAILAASGQIKPDKLPINAFGELTLNGQIRGVPGAISRYTTLCSQEKHHFLIPQANYGEVRLIADRQAVFVSTLQEAVARLNAVGANVTCDHSESESPFTEYLNEQNPKTNEVRNISSIIGQDQAVRALEISAAGHHNLLLLGSPGCGKTALVSTMTGLLPPLSMTEALELTRVYSAAGLLDEADGIIRRRPFRAPHHTITRAAMIGGGNIPKPGEISLAHHGVLFLDEMTEFEPSILDTLRQPMEEQQIRISRSQNTVNYPASFLLVGAANPCRCGNYYEEGIHCTCSEEQINQHFSRLSGPLLDRIDLVVGVSRLCAEALQHTVEKAPYQSRDSAFIAARIRKSRERQIERCRNHGVLPAANGCIRSTSLAELFLLPSDLLKKAASAAEQLQLTVRGYQKILRIARTIADLEDEETVMMKHLGEALQYRSTIGGVK